MTRIAIAAGEVRAEAGLNDNDTAAAICETLPIGGRANTWGDEICFETPIEHSSSADAREEVEVGGRGYWPPESALCHAFGRTPAGPENPLGHVMGEARALASVKDRRKVALRRA